MLLSEAICWKRGARTPSRASFEFVVAQPQVANDDDEFADDDEAKFAEYSPKKLKIGKPHPDPVVGTV